MLASRLLPELNSAHASAKHAERICVTVLVGAYLPGYKAGGPIRSIANMTAALGSDIQFRIVTRDRDLGQKSPYPGVVTDQWVRVREADVMYLRPGLRGFLRIYALLRAVDRDTVLYLNSFFGRWFSMLAVGMCWLRLCRPRCLVVAPRGEFSPGALRFKPLRKRLYLKASQWMGLHDCVLWHASSDFEAADISRQISLAKNVHVAPVLIAPDHAGAIRPSPRPGRKQPGQLRAVFVGRIARNKNLGGAIRMLAGVAGDVSLDIYGPAEDGEYWDECQGLIAALPSNIRVRYCGEIAHEGIAQVLAEHDLMVFPTLGENYGHVICEALSSGCPVLISDQTPWRNLEAEGIGWDIPLGETERFRSALQQCVEGGHEWHLALSRRAMAYAAQRASDGKTLDANRALFQRAFHTKREDI